MLLLYCQHWHFNSVIENYISGKLVCTMALTVSWQWLINYHHFSQDFCIQSYRIASYNVGSLGAIVVVFTFLNSWQGSHLTAQLTFASLKAQHYVKLLCTTPNRPLSTSKFYVDFKNIFSKGPKNDTHLLFFDVLLLVGHFFELKNSRVRSFYLPRTHKRSSDGIFSSHPWFLIV